jgi:pimeloyl-ACP methyl ester carboxylesterase
MVHTIKLLLLSTFLVCPSLLLADGPKDNETENVRQIPPSGIELTAADRGELEAGLTALRKQIDQLRTRRDKQSEALLPDVEIFYRAVHVALKYREFFAPRDVNEAKQLLAHGRRRATQLAAGQAPWTTQTGLVVRGYVSRIDDSVQPYGLVIPASYSFEGKSRHRLDLWLHGRGERLSENNFLAQRMKQVGQIAPRDTIVLHPYGRYSNAFKFAGEVDVLEALAAVKRHYRVDSNRIAVRGFSMGGAGCWQFAVHYADRWFAANPGAGFSETPEFLKFFQKETLTPTVYEEKLWRLYDCDRYAANLYNCPTVAYSGELDIQKQAADIMEAALADEQMTLTHIIGPQTKHRIHPESAQIIERRLHGLAARGRARLPRRVQLVTYTLKYNSMHWLQITGMYRHWEEARVVAEIAGRNRIVVETSNISGLSLSMPAGTCPFDVRLPVRVEVNGELFKAPRPATDRSWSFHLWGGKSQPLAGPPTDGLHKRHNLQGPIDDAFMDRFIVVRPTGLSPHPSVQKWTISELEHCLEHWRRHFRGDAIVKNDHELTAEDIASANLVLFGDPTSNAVIGKIVAKLPIQWSREVLQVGHRKFAVSHHAPALVFPNPLNTNRYVVLNSGFTFREYDYLNNARQVPKLPDWAIVDLRTPPNSRGPGRIVAADFFDETWDPVQE